MASWGKRMLLASLNRKKPASEGGTNNVFEDSDDPLDVNRAQKSGTSHVFDVDPDDPFDVNSKLESWNEQEDGDRVSDLLSEQDRDDDYVPGTSESDGSSDDESVISICVSDKAEFMPTVVNDMEAAVSKVPSVVNDMEDAVSKVPSVVNDMEDAVSKVPSVVNDMEDAVSKVPSVVNEMEDAVSKVPSVVNDMDAAVSKNGRVKRPCSYCGMYQSQLLRHLKRKHQEEEAVKVALKLPKQDQVKAFDKIRKIGIFYKNVELHKEGATLIRERRQGCVDDLAMCNGCKGFFKTKQIWRHKKTCSDLTGHSTGSIRFSNLLIKAPDIGVSESFKKNIIDCFRDDEAGKLCRTDKLILKFGMLLSGKKKMHKHTIMSDMRILANIIVQMRILKHDDALDSSCIVNREHFETLREAIRKLSLTDGGTLKAGMKLKMGFVLKRFINVCKGHYIQTDQLDMDAEMDRFSALLKVNWDFIFYSAQLQCEQRRSNLRKPQVMPVEEDLIKLRNFIVDEMRKLVSDIYKKWDVHSFVFLRNLVVSRLTAFNARRGGEPARLTVKEWEDADNNVWIDPQLVQQISDPLEKSMIENYKLAYQAGKGFKKLVPILIPVDTVLPMQKLMELRAEVDIPSSNPYLFATTGGSDNHVNGWHSVNMIVNQISDQLERPSLLIADKFRHRVSTLFALLELPAEDRNKFYRHMGHSEEINKNVYQSPLALGEIITVGGFLQKIDRSAANLSTGNVSSDLDVPQDVRIESVNQSAVNNILEPESTSSDASMIPSLSNIVEDSTVSDNEEPHTTSMNPSLKNVVDESAASDSQELSTSPLIPSQPKANKKVRRYYKWNENDTKIVRDFFSEYIVDKTHEGVKGSLPGRKLIEEFLENFKIFLGTSISHDTLINLVKTKVFNERKKERSSHFKTV